MQLLRHAFVFCTLLQVLFVASAPVPFVPADGGVDVELERRERVDMTKASNRALFIKSVSDMKTPFDAMQARYDLFFAAAKWAQQDQNKGNKMAQNSARTLANNIEGFMDKAVTARTTANLLHENGKLDDHVEAEKVMKSISSETERNQWKKAMVSYPVLAKGIQQAYNVFHPYSHGNKSKGPPIKSEQ